MSFEKNIWINTDQRELVPGFLETISEPTIDFTQGDTVPLLIYLLKQRTNNQGQPYDNIEITTETLKIALGRLDEPATGGTFILTYGANSTSALPYNETVANVETALNALASIISAGGVTVSGADSGPYTVDFVTNGARTDFSGDLTLTIPSCDLIVIEKTVGDGSTRESQVLKIKESPVALQETFAAIAAPTIAVTEVIKGATGINEVQKVKIDQECQDGNFSLSYDSSSAVIVYGATAAEVVTALVTTGSIASGDVAVQKISDQEYDVTFQGALAATDVAMLVADSAGLIGFSGFTADFSLASYAVEELLGSADDLTTGLYFEVELTNSGEKTTLLRIPATIENDLIDEGVTSPPANGTDWQALLDAKITGPASAVDDNIMLFDSTTGKLAKDSGINTSAITANTAKLTADETNVVAALDGATLTAVTVATGDKVVIQDLSDSDNIKTVTAQSIADLFDGVTAEEAAAGTDRDDTSTSDTLVLTDADNKTVWYNNAGAIAVTIPTNASVAFPVGTKINLMMEGAGVPTVTGDTGVTVNGVSGGSFVINNQYQGATITKRATNTWIGSGDIT